MHNLLILNDLNGIARQRLGTPGSGLDGVEISEWSEERFALEHNNLIYLPEFKKRTTRSAFKNVGTQDSDLYDCYQYQSFGDLTVCTSSMAMPLFSLPFGTVSSGKNLARLEILFEFNMLVCWHE